MVSTQPQTCAVATSAHVSPHSPTSTVERVRLTTDPHSALRSETVSESAPPTRGIGRSADATAELDETIRRFQQTGDATMLERIMTAYDWVAIACARRMQRRGEPLEDLEQVAREAIVGAAQRFDCDRGVSFKSFAWATAVGALRHHYRSRWQVRVPRGLQEMHLATVKALGELTAAEGCEPTVDELAVYMDADREDVILGLDVRHAYLVDSLDHQQGDERSGRFDRALGAVDQAIEATADRVNVRELLDGLPPEERTALKMYYFEGRTQAEVGAALGISQAQVSRLMRVALDTLRSHSAHWLESDEG